MSQDRELDRQNGGIDVVAGGGALPVDITGIERELASLWEPADEAAGTGDAEAITRACTLTLVVYAESQAQVERAARVIPRVSAQDPCRAIVVSADPSASDDLLEAYISANCFLPGPGVPQVCCEQINITARGSATARVPGLVSPLLVSDLPVVVWWLAGPPLDNPVFGRLADASDRVVVDSAVFSDACFGLALLSQAALGRYRRVAFSDLNWARLTPWRNLTAQFFDSPVALPYLETIDSIAVDYAITSGPDGGDRLNRAQGALLAGWLASRLGWSVETGCAASRGADCSHCLRSLSAARVQIDIRPAGPGVGSDGEVLTTRIHAAGNPGATFAITQSEDATCVVTSFEVDGRPAVTRVVRLEPVDDAVLLCQELEVLERDRVFEEALGVVGLLASRDL